jgi:CheY-like chemotaxis protein
MTEFQVLLVDDEEVKEHEKIARLDKDDRITLVPVGSLEEARREIADRFFHLALVDLQLDPDDDSNVDGQYLLRELYDSRPTCRRILFTSTSAEHRDSISKLANPDGPLIHGAIDKGDFAHDWVRWLKKRAVDWQTQQLEVEGLEALRSSLPDALFDGAADSDGQVRTTDEELKHVISKLFTSDRADDDVEAGAEIVRVQLQPLPGGESRAVVLLARLVSRDELGAVTCVLKIAPKKESSDERHRYESFARFRVSAERRAELLGSYLGDTVGAAAYAFAGRSPDEIIDLEALFKQESDEVLPILDRLFENESSDLWRVLADAGSDQLPADLGTFFSEAYDLKPLKVGKEVDDYLTKHASEYGLVRGKQAFEPESHDAKLELPSAKFYGDAKVRTSYHAGVIHGDLNATNVLILDEDRMRLIDFRHARVGPIAVDFAALETSVRLAGDLGSVIDTGLFSILDSERRAVKQPWREDTGKDAGAKPPPYWAEVSNHIGRLCRKVTEDKVSQREYWATCLLFALRIFRPNSLGREKRIRLIPWIAALRWALADSDGP